MCPQCARHCGGALRVHLILRISLRGILRRFLGECRHAGLRAPLDGTLCIAAQPRTLPGRCPPFMSPELHLFPLLPRRCDSKPQCLTQVPSRPGCSSARAAAAALPPPARSGAAAPASQTAGPPGRRSPTARGCSGTPRVRPVSSSAERVRVNSGNSFLTSKAAGHQNAATSETDFSLHRAC